VNEKVTSVGSAQFIPRSWHIAEAADWVNGANRYNTGVQSIALTKPPKNRSISARRGIVVEFPRCVPACARRIECGFNGLVANTLF
jgi:hypothetical protein